MSIRALSPTGRMPATIVIDSADDYGHQWRCELRIGPEGWELAADNQAAEPKSVQRAANLIPAFSAWVLEQTQRQLQTDLERIGSASDLATTAALATRIAHFSKALNTRRNNHANQQVLQPVSARTR